MITELRHGVRRVSRQRLLSALGVVALAGLVVAIADGFAIGVLGVAVVVPVVIALLRRPQRGVLLLVALVPFNGLLLIAPLPGFVGGWKEALTVATLAATWLCPSEARAPAGRRIPTWTVAVGGLLLLGVVSAVAVGGSQAATGLKVGFFYLLAALAVWRCPLDARERDRLVSILMVVGFITSIVGLVQQALGHQRLHDLGYAYNTVIRFAGSHLRSFSTFNQPFPFALFVMLVLLICVPVALADTTRLRNRLFLLVLPLYVLGILSAFVRAAWLGLAIGFLYLGVRRYHVLLAAIPLALIAFLVFGGSISEPVLQSQSLQQRTSGWEQNLSQLRAHPLGLGLGSSGAVAEKVTAVEVARTGKRVYQPDNYYFLIVYELGLIGLWLFVLLLVAAFRSTQRIADSLDGPDQAFSEGVVAMVLAASVCSLVSTYFEIFPMDLMFWLLLTIVATIPALHGNRTGSSARQPSPEVSKR